ncbi:MAG: DinB family protein [Cyclobacteriaceae bacterium]
MQKSFELLKATRTNILNVTEHLPIDHLFRIPAHANNHIFWNMAHTIVTQQILCYKFAGLDPRINTSLIDKYKKGTIPDSHQLHEEVSLFRKLSLTTVDQLQEDYENNIFKEYKTYETSYGFGLNSIEDAITFNNVHEAMHLGQVKQMIR